MSSEKREPSVVEPVHFCAGVSRVPLAAPAGWAGLAALAGWGAEGRGGIEGGAHLVLLDNLSESDDLCVGEADEGVGVVADAVELALVLGEAALAAEDAADGLVVGGCLVDPAIDGAVEGV